MRDTWRQDGSQLAIDLEQRAQYSSFGGLARDAGRHWGSRIVPAARRSTGAGARPGQSVVSAACGFTGGR
jgi:hypothetical protein